LSHGPGLKVGWYISGPSPPVGSTDRDFDIFACEESSGRRQAVMTHKYRGCIIVLSINKSVEPNEEQKVLMSGFDQGFTVNTSKQVFRGNWQYE
jgi:hypothetical protein